MKKLLYVLCGVVVFCSSCNRMNVCEETIEKLILTENGFCNITLRENLISIVDKLGDVDPRKYSEMFQNQLQEIRNFNGVNIIFIASFPSLQLAYDMGDGLQPAWMSMDATDIILGIPCNEEYNPHLVGKRVELYEAICKYYRQKYSPSFEEADGASTFFHVKASSNENLIMENNTVVIQQIEEGDCVVILINDDEGSYERWRNGEL